MRRGGGNGRWRWCIFDHDDLSQSASVVDLLNFAVADGVLVRSLALTCRHWRSGDGVGIAVDPAVETECGVGVWWKQRRRRVLHRSLHGGCRCRGRGGEEEREEGGVYLGDRQQ